MAEEPLVSVIMPVFNAANTLKRAIDSVLNQDHLNLELLVIDNASADESKTIASGYSDPRVRVFHQEKKGAAATRNVGLEVAKGAFICFLDADDELPPKSISSRVFEMENSELDFVDGSVEFIGSRRKTWVPKRSKDLLKGLVHLNGDSFCGVTWMVRTEILGSLRFNEEMSHSEDLLFSITLAKKGGQYGYTNEITYRVHVGKESLMSNLHGLKDGYLQTFLAIEKMELPKEWVEAFRQKARSIMIKSFLKDGQIKEAWKSHRSFLLD